MTACFVADDPFRCPAKWELFRQILDLLPRGRAWQTHEQVYERIDSLIDGLPNFALDESSLSSGDDPSPDLAVSLTVQQRYWAAFAEVLAYLHARACALTEEFFCATTSEQLADWQADWGFPDACEAYPQAASSASRSRPPASSAAWHPTRPGRRTSPSICRKCRSRSHACGTRPPSDSPPPAPAGSQ
jgi:hypothetical protein